MAIRQRRNQCPAFKVWAGSENSPGDCFPFDRVTVAAIKGENASIGLAQGFDVQLNQIKQWRDQLVAGATGVFGDSPKTRNRPLI